MTTHVEDLHDWRVGVINDGDARTTHQLLADAILELAADVAFCQAADRAWRKDHPAAVPWHKDEAAPAMPPTASGEDAPSIDPVLWGLLTMLLTYGGRIVCTAALDVRAIADARAAGRLWVSPDGYGFVYLSDAPAQAESAPPDWADEMARGWVWRGTDGDAPGGLAAILRRVRAEEREACAMVRIEDITAALAGVTGGAESSHSDVVLAYRRAIRARAEAGR